MPRYAVLLRGINVGGKNKLSMRELKAALDDLGFTDVRTLLQSGNVVLGSPLGARAVAEKIEDALTRRFRFDSELIRVLAISRTALRAIVDDRPKGFGDSPGTYHSDAIFLIGITARETLPAFSPLEGVDTIWPGRGVIYSQRLSAKRTKSRLNRVMASPLYKCMTIRSWQTTLKLIDALDAESGA